MLRSVFGRTGFCFATTACLTWLLPSYGGAAGPNAANVRETPVVRDIALDGSSRMVGQFVDAQGQPQANQPVFVLKQGGTLKQFTTDASGRFVADGITPGIYQIATTNAAMVCRCWSHGTAPPAAQRDMLIVAGEGVQRGQRPLGELLFSGPMLIALVIAAAIAIPIAIHNSQDAS